MPNRLAGETSLYLRQHANNPVDWHPWSPAAIELARTRDCPIFLSVGYSACHWCHVMEHECFENSEIAAVLNEHFVCIKVDREERPDLDQIYMTSHALLTREGGGWPLSVFLTPNLTPFYAGTYFPPDDRYAPSRPSFPNLLNAIASAWNTKRDQLNDLGEQVKKALDSRSESRTSNKPLSLELLKNAARVLKRGHDPVNGGFGTAPKFPHPIDLQVLLRAGDEFLFIVRLSLEKMARGGIYDQVGGGFHRYSVDARWLVPHFEKMLYDNALLPPAYLEAYQKTGDPFFAHIVRETLDFVLREMTSPAGAFYSTQDADSEGEEGKFYVWEAHELETTVGPEFAELARRTFGVTEHGNFEGRNILFRSKTDEQDARLNNREPDQFLSDLRQVKDKLYAERLKRIAPGRDEKILTSWNGLMIAALAKAGAVLGEPRYTKAAENAAWFILTNLRDSRGRLFRTCGDSQPGKLPGFLDDYAYAALAFAELYQTTFDPKWLRAASEFAEVIRKHFADSAGGGFFYTPDDHEQLIARTKDLQDGSIPSGNATAALALFKLALLTGRGEFRTAAERTLTSHAEMLEETPAAAGQMLIALDFHLNPADEIAVIGAKESEEGQRVLRFLHERFQPNRVLAFYDPNDGPPPASIPLLADKPALGTVTTYICRDFTCAAPLVGFEAVQAHFAAR